MKLRNELNRYLRRITAIWQIGPSCANWAFEFAALFARRMTQYSLDKRFTKNVGIDQFTLDANASQTDIRSVLIKYGVCVLKDFIDTDSAASAQQEVSLFLEKKLEPINAFRSDKTHDELDNFIWQTDYAISSEYTHLANHAKPFVNIRSRQPGVDDAGMVDIFGFEKLVGLLNLKQCKAIINAINESSVKETIEKISGYKQRQFNLYLNQGVTQTRGPHIDSNNNNYKLFVYLSDVIDKNNGPYCYLPSSHKNRSWMSYERLKNAVLDLPTTEVSSVKRTTLTPLLASAGTAIITCQSGVHCGWPQSKEASRTVLVSNFF